MNRILTPEPSLPGAPGGAAPETGPAETGDYELVLGGRQMASLGVLALAVLGIATGGAYVVGKSAGRTVEKIVTVEAPAAPAPPVAAPAPAPLAADAAPLFGPLERGKLYVQLASVERGYAQLMVRGVRQAGYPAVVGEGMNSSVYRVLAGPFDSPEEAARVKSVFDSMGLSAFVRRGEALPAATPAP
jgi:hypothetical protein